MDQQDGTQLIKDLNLSTKEKSESPKQQKTETLTTAGTTEQEVNLSQKMKEDFKTMNNLLFEGVDR